jgi:hydrogenase expression/formation protein HypD
VHVTEVNLDNAAFSDPELCRGLLHKLEQELDRPLRFMEVCGTHTVAIFRSGLRSLLPEGIEHLSGPGCPVCVTHDREIAACMNLAAKDGVCIATFGDLMRVPGPDGKTLKQAQAEGADVAVVYSPLDALDLARQRPDQAIVFLGVGFETTAPTVAATVQMARREKLSNFAVLAFHKLVPPALDALLATGAATEESTSSRGIDAFLLPGHVSTILGMEPYRFMVDIHGKPGVIGGFDPADILQSLLLMVDMRKKNKPAIVNQYSRAVSDTGNEHARAVLFDVFAVSAALWRGIGEIPASGLSMRAEYEAYDAWKRFAIALPEVPDIKGCKCGDVLKGLRAPNQCPLFGKACTPATPVGPCMVSTEGSCAAYFKYALH